MSHVSPMPINGVGDEGTPNTLDNQARRSPVIDTLAGMVDSNGNGSGNGNGTNLDSPTIRALGSVLVERFKFAQRAGLSFFDTATGQWKRNLYHSLGYETELTFDHYVSRYQRGGIAERIIDAYPAGTWSGGARVVEDPDPSTQTEFERAANELFDRLQIWHRITRADILSGLGNYSILLIGAPGQLSAPLPKRLKADDIRYLTPIGQNRVDIESIVENENDERFGLPDYYLISLGVGTSSKAYSTSSHVQKKKVHWSRVVHVADGLLDSDLFGRPRLRAVWNYLDDLDKIIGGGAEAAWKRMDPGMQIDVDPALPFTPSEQDALSDEIDEMINGLRRYMRTRGAKVNLLSTTVAGFGPNADAIVKLISATTGIPYRILTGSERGELASTQDRLNWSDRIAERRRSFATPLVRQLLGRLIERNVLPAPKGVDQVPIGEGATGYAGNYTILWPEVGQVDNASKADLISKITAANQAQFIANQPPVMLSNEIRRIILGLGPLKPEEIPPTKADSDEETNGNDDGMGDVPDAGADSGAAGNRGNDETVPSPAGVGGPNARQ